MDSRQTQFEWRVAENEDEWYALAAMPLSTCRQAQRRRWPSRRRLNVFGLILSLVVCVATVSGYLIWRKAEAGLQLVEREVQETAYIEEWTTHRRALRTAPVQMGGVLSPQHTTMEPPPMPAVEVESANLQGDRVMARVLVERLTAHGDPTTYRETRFYRQTNDGWQRTGPDLALLGPWRTLETKFFLILYPQFHAQTAKEAATRLDAQFVQFRQDFGLPLTVDGPKITLEMAESELPLMLTHVDVANRTIRVPIPALLSLPAQLDDTDIFLQSISLRLSQLVRKEAEEERSDRWRVLAGYWHPLLDAINLWHLWQSSDQLLVWRYEPTLAPSEAGQKPRSGSVNGKQGQPVPIDPACTGYIIWGRSVMAMDAATACRELPTSPSVLTGSEVVDAQMFLSSSVDSPSKLPLLTSPQQWKGNPYATAQDTLITYIRIVDYVVAVHGRDRLPVLFDALGNHLGWRELMPAVFEMPVDEFEEGWRAYWSE